MNFEHALEAMRQGKKVRRMSWNDGSYICFNSAGDIVVENGCLFPLFLDWEIYEEPQKEPEMTAGHAIERLERDTEPEHKCNACHCNCSHTGKNSDLQVEMEQALSRKFFELVDTTTDSLAVSNMIEIYKLLFEVK